MYRVPFIVAMVGALLALPAAYAQRRPDDQRALRMLEAMAGRGEFAVTERQAAPLLRLYAGAVADHVRANKGKLPRRLDQLVEGLGGPERVASLALVSGYFAMVDPLGRKLDQVLWPQETVLMYWTSADRRGRRLVLTVDGQVRTVEAEAFREMLSEQGVDSPAEAPPDTTPDRRDRRR